MMTDQVIVTVGACPFTSMKLCLRVENSLGSDHANIRACFRVHTFQFCDSLVRSSLYKFAYCAVDMSFGEQPSALMVIKSGGLPQS